MAAMEMLHVLAGINNSYLNKSEIIILEADLLVRLSDELQGLFRNQIGEYLHYLKFDVEKENAMFESKFISMLIKDILSTSEYTLAGIAYQTKIPEDVLDEIIIGVNTSPSITVFRRIIELHRSVRIGLYDHIFRKITSEVTKHPR